MVKRTLKDLNQMLQEFKRIFDYFVNAGPYRVSINFSLSKKLLSREVP